MKTLCLVAALLATGSGTPPAAAPAPEEVLTIPGGVTAFRRVAGLGDGDHAPGAVVADYARVYYKSASDQTTGTKKIADYFEFLEKLTAVTAGWNSGVSFASADASKPVNEQLKDFADLAGIHLRTVQKNRVAEVATGDDELKRQAWMAAIGVDVKQVVAKLNAGQAIQCPIPVDQVPLPDPTLFNAEVFRGDRFPMLRLVSDRSASLFYTGMLSLDTPTRAMVEKQFNLGRDLMGGRAAAFAVFGRSIHVRDGALALPGGPDAVPVWEAIVGEPTGKPANFLKSVLDKDEGRAAYFLDVVTHLDAAHQQFVLGGSLKGKARIEFVRDVYDAFKEPMGAWKVEERPFLLPGFGAALAVAMVDVSANGTLGPDWLAAALTFVDDNHGWPSKPVTRKFARAPADARWFFKWLAAEPAIARQRFALLRFAQRRLGRDASFSWDAELALRTMSEMPSLALSLERIGVEKPALFGVVGGAAWKLSQSGDREGVSAPMRRWQSALALIEQTTRRQALPPATIDALLRSLAGIAAMPATQGHIADWLFTTALPAIAPDLASRPGPTVEARALHGLMVGAAEGPQFTWEGLSYRLATGAVAARDAWAIRESASGPTLDDVSAVRDVFLAMKAPLKPDQLPKFADRLAAVARTIGQLQDAAGHAPQVAGDLADWAAEWRKIKPKDVAKVSKLSPKLGAAVDEVTAIVLPRMVYALAVAPTSQPPAIYASLADRHDVTPATTRGDWHPLMWLHAKNSGTLLGLDVDLADSQPREAGSTISPATQLNAADHDSWLAALALSRVDAAADERARAQIAGAIRAGRDRVAAFLKGGPPEAAALESALAASGASEVIASLAAFELRQSHPEAVTRLLRPMDFYQLGTTAPWPDAWGGAPANTSGCLCLESMMRRSPESWLGYPGAGVLTASLHDGNARLAELLTEMKLPGWLLTPLLPFLTADTLHHTQQFGPDDWQALQWARHLDAARVEEWMLALVAAGILAPPAGGVPPP